MEQNRYTNTLAEIPAHIVEIKSVGIPMELINKRTEDGYILSDGCSVRADHRYYGKEQYARHRHVYLLQIRL